MMKLATVLLATMLVALSYGAIIDNVGGYVDHPDLIESRDVKALASLAAEHMAISQNLVLDKIKVTRVQIQLVAGMNYKIDFTATQVNGISGKLSNCQTVIYARFDGTKSVTEAHCN